MAAFPSMKTVPSPTRAFELTEMKLNTPIKKHSPNSQIWEPMFRIYPTSRSELYNIQMVEETITNGNVSIKVRFGVY